MPMKLRAVMSFDYGSAKEARSVAEALEPDNEGFVRTTIEGKVMRATAMADSAEGLRHTLEDFLACLKVAEEAVGIKGAAKKEGKEEGDEDV
jgi:hypothetical protein